MVTWTETQLRRLQELDASESDLKQHFENADAREDAFHEIEKKQAQKLRQRLKTFREVDLRPGLCRLEAKLAGVECRKGSGSGWIGVRLSRHPDYLRGVAVARCGPALLPNDQLG